MPLADRISNDDHLVGTDPQTPFVSHLAWTGSEDDLGNEDFAGRDHHVKFPPIIAPAESERYPELVLRRELLKTFVDDLHIGPFWEQDAFPGPLPDQVERQQWARTRSLAYFLLDDLSCIRLHVLALRLDAPTALDLFEAAVNGGWGLRLSYDEADLWQFRAAVPRPIVTPVWVVEPLKPRGYLYRNRVNGLSGLCAQYLSDVRELIAQRPHLNQTVLDNGNIVGAVYRHFATLEDLRRLQDGPSVSALYYGSWFRDAHGQVYKRVRKVERRLLLGLVLEDGNPDYEGWMYPPEDAFLAPGRWALRAYHVSDLDFVRRRATEIESGVAKPKTRSEWVVALRMGSRRRKESQLSTIVRSTIDQAMWELYGATRWNFLRGLWDLEQLGDQLSEALASSTVADEHLPCDGVGGSVTGRDAAGAFSSVTT